MRLPILRGATALLLTLLSSTSQAGETSPELYAHLLAGELRVDDRAMGRHLHAEFGGELGDWGRFRLRRDQADNAQLDLERTALELGWRLPLGTRTALEFWVGQERVDKRVTLQSDFVEPGGSIRFRRKVDDPLIGIGLRMQPSPAWDISVRLNAFDRRDDLFGPLPKVSSEWVVEYRVGDSLALVLAAGAGEDYRQMLFGPRWVF
jgi:hypothetical protein